MVTRKTFWAATAGTLLAAAGCAQIFGVDRDYQQVDAGPGGAGSTTSGSGSSSSSSTGSSSNSSGSSGSGSSSTTGSSSSSSSSGTCSTTASSSGGTTLGKTCKMDGDCPGLACCAGFCVDLQADPQNCGMCGVTCPSPTMSCTATGCSSWAAWPMPNPAEITDAGLPNLARYDSSTAGVVKDLVTHLVWQQPLATAGTCAAPCVLSDATAYCASLSLATYPAGSWRVPTRIELVSLVDSTQSMSTVATINAAFLHAPMGYSWTSSFTPQDTGQVYVVDFTYGTTQSDDATSTNLVRCVH